MTICAEKWRKAVIYYYYRYIITNFVTIINTSLLLLHTLWKWVLQMNHKPNVYICYGVLYIWLTVEIL